MIHALKSYQREALLALRDFWSRCAGPERRGRPAAIAEAFAGCAPVLGSAYVHPPGLDTVPTICVKVPTGGGKTFIAANACGVAKAAYLQCEHPLIVWLAPTGAIVEQTIACLRQPQHPCHRAAVEGCDVAAGLGPIRVVSVDEALSLGPAAYASAAIVIVATVQQFRAESTDGRRVYADNPRLREHKVLGDASLANVIASRRPLIVVDEAHNVRTALSFETLARLGPGLVLEITATPSRRADSPSNVVYSASPKDLFDEGMIRLPIEVAASEHADACLDWALATRDRLEREADAELARGAEPVRPILLIQADATREGRATDDEATIRRRLVDEFSVPPERIAVHTGKQRDLEGIDLLSRDCPVTIVITKAALKEGWDCPWAYVLCTLRPSLSDTEAVQLVGRILRQHRATRHAREPLNRAYVAARCASIATALGELRASLVEELGYEAGLAQMQVQATQLAILGALPEPLRLSGVAIDPERARSLPSAILDKVLIDATAGTVTRMAATSHAEDRVLGGIYTKPEDAAACAAMGRRSRAHAVGSASDLTSAQVDGEPPALYIPRLTVPGPDGVQEVISDRHYDGEGYCPSAASHRIPFVPAEVVLARGRATVAATSVVYEVDEQGESLGETAAGDPTARLAYFLSSRIAPPCFVAHDRHRWVMDLLGYLERDRSIAIGDLWADRYRLLAAAERAIEQDIERASHAEIQRTLFGAGDVQASDRALDFAMIAHDYQPSGYERNGYSWRKHAFPPGPATMDSKNERDCAIAIDSHANVDRWIRNIPPRGFCIPRPPRDGKRWFYPDFIAWLRNGRIVVVEHKGPLRPDDAEDQAKAGEFWALHTGQRFVMVREDARGQSDFSELRRILAGG